MLLSSVLLLGVGFSARWLLGAAPPAPATLQVFDGPTMGTTFQVKLVVPASAPDADRSQVRAAIEGELTRIDALMSTWDPNSELSRFNRHLAGTRFRVSPQTLAVFGVAREVSEKSGGALDVTVGPLVDAWGFGPSGFPPRPPSQQELARLAQAVGYGKVEIDGEAGTLMKRHPNTVCDLSAVAKGFAVDRVGRALQDLGFSDFLVEVGGEIRAEGARPDGRPWQLGIESPDPDRSTIHRIVTLSGAAMASSGDYRKYYEADGVWLSHLIDPRSGRPISHDLAAVSVIHRDGARADAWATALMVLGPEDGFAVASREGLAAYFIERTAEGALRARATPTMEPLLETP